MFQHYSVGKPPGKSPMRARMEKAGIMNRIRNRCLFIAMAFAVWWLVFVYRFVSDGRSTTPAVEAETRVHQIDISYLEREQSHTLKSRIPEKFATRDALSKVEEGCAGKYVYIHHLPRRFHEGILAQCGNLSLWFDMCREVVNSGFGQTMEDSDGVFSKTGWYATNQFSLEIIFHHKVTHYKCRTMDSSKANAIFVPFYSGVEVMPHLWDGASISHRDEVPNEFAKWLTSQPEWSRMYGHDHFMIGGRVTWDFRRQTNEEWDWGNRLLLLEPLKNMTTLTIEASPWHNWDVGVPYPTYLHPSTDQEVFDWQDHVATVKRKSLFCFAGAPRPKQDTSIRAQIMTQCRESEYCNLLECTKDAGKCHEPANVMRLFKESHFCLQPAGDSYTRRSLFDSILSGCIPVVFHEYSAYTQYGWFFPEQNSSYSVFIDEEFIRAENVSIEEVLRSFSAQEIEAMRKVVISLIPRILYSSPISEMTLKDAFDLSIEGVIERIVEYQRVMEEEAKSLAYQKDKAVKEVQDAKARLDSILRAGFRDR
ncbi:unnamed protein product [Calypogeia fissa]